MTSDDLHDQPLSLARFEATIHPGERHRSIRRLPALDLDQLPDPDGRTRVLITLDDIGRLVQLGFEVRVVRSAPIRPLDGAAVADDDTTMTWLEERVKAIDLTGLKRNEDN